MNIITIFGFIDFIDVETIVFSRYYLRSRKDRKACLKENDWLKVSI